MIDKLPEYIMHLKILLNSSDEQPNETERRDGEIFISASVFLCFLT